MTHLLDTPYAYNILPSSSTAHPTGTIMSPQLKPSPASWADIMEQPMQLAASPKVRSHMFLLVPSDKVLLQAPGAISWARIAKGDAPPPTPPTTPPAPLATASIPRTPLEPLPEERDSQEEKRRQAALQVLFRWLSSSLVDFNLSCCADGG